jgi:hypothetical protein
MAGALGFGEKAPFFILLCALCASVAKQKPDRPCGRSGLVGASLLCLPSSRRAIRPMTSYSVSRHRPAWQSVHPVRPTGSVCVP